MPILPRRRIFVFNIKRINSLVGGVDLENLFQFIGNTIEDSGAQITINNYATNGPQGLWTGILC